MESIITSDNLLDHMMHLLPLPDRHGARCVSRLFLRSFRRLERNARDKLPPILKNAPFGHQNDAASKTCKPIHYPHIPEQHRQAQIDTSVVSTSSKVLAAAKPLPKRRPGRPPSLNVRTIQLSFASLPELPPTPRKPPLRGISL